LHQSNLLQIGSSDILKHYGRGAQVVEANAIWAGSGRAADSPSGSVDGLNRDRFRTPSETEALKQRLNEIELDAFP